MVKADYSRDYYADLELPPTADIVEVKKQFRKLALKYHPDRNPGRENEVNARFQTIQSAHEILTSPGQKAKYDANRARNSSRFPTASGVRGNPWQNVSAQYPPPPPRPGMPKRSAPSAASRFSSFNVPQTPKPSQEDPERRYEAWKNMRPSPSKGRSSQPGGGGSTSTSTARETRPPPPPPPPPRAPPSASQRQKTEASFGARRSGFAPKSPVGDEPQAANTSNYSTTRTHTSLFDEMPAGARRPRRASASVEKTNMFRDSFMETRQSTPYQSRGGERLNPFDGVANLGRAKSTREGYRRSDDEPDSPSKSHRRSSSVPDGSENSAQTDGQRTPQGSDTSPANRPSNSRFGERYKPSGDGEQAQKPFTTPTTTHNRSSDTSLPDRTAPTSNGGQVPAKPENPSGFAFPVPDSSFVRSAADPSHIMRNSTENINTRFVAEDFANADWHFNASAAAAGQDATGAVYRRSQSGSRAGRRSPAKDRPAPMAPPPSTGGMNGVDQGFDHGPKPGGFDAEEWTQKIGVEHFAPRVVPPVSASPTRPVRPAKKPRPVLKTMGTAGLVGEDETSSSGEEKNKPSAAAADADAGARSPNAMDIDPPVVEPVAKPQVDGGARNIPVEPSRPEWRAGDVDGAKPSGVPQKIPFSANNTAGSEDTDGFSTSFADLRNVEPIASAATGLGSLDDLKANLPFESKASAKPPIGVPKPIKKQIKFPRAPAAPRPPPTVTTAAWEKYAADFTQYMDDWRRFNDLYIDHFEARRSIIAKQRKEMGYSFLSTRTDAGIREYMDWLEQDREIRVKWTAASTEHEQRVREFMAYRNTVSVGSLE